MKIKWPTPSALFIKYLISYVVLVLFPIVVLVGATLGFFINSFQKENLKMASGVLEQSVRSFDDRISQLTKTTINIMENPYLSRAYLNNFTSNQVISSYLLRSYNSTNGFTYKILLSYFGDDEVISPYGIMTEPYISDYIYKSPELEQGYVREKLLAQGESYFQKSRSHSSTHGDLGYLYVCPLPLKSSDPSGYVIYLIDSQKIESELDALARAVNGPVYLVDVQPDSQEILCKDSLSPQQDGEPVLSPDRKTAWRDGMEYSVIPLASDTTGLVFCAFVRNRDGLASGTQPFLRLMMAAVCMVLLLSGLLIYRLMRANYKPLHDLMQNVFPSGARPKDLSTLQSAVSTMSHKLVDLEDYYAKTVDEQCNLMLINLLTGNYGQMDGFKKDCAEHDILIEGPFFTAATLLFSKLGQEEKRELCKRVTHFGEIRCYPVNIFEKNRVVLLLFSPVGDEELLRQGMLSVHRLFKPVPEAVLTVGVGNWVSSPEDIPNAYLNSLTALDYRLVRGLDKVILYSSVSGFPEFKYPQQLYDKFQSALLSGKPDGIAESVDQIFSEIKQNDISIVNTRSFCYNIVQLAVRTLYRKRSSSTQEALSTMNRLIQSETIDALADSLKKICVQLLDTASQAANAKPAVRHIGGMISYVQEHCCDPNFSLQSMADGLGLSPSYVSRYFAANEGVTLIDYVTRLRMEKAAELLEDSAIPLPDIAQAVGYLNISSFTRKFKEKMGLPPGAWRQRQKKQKEPGHAGT